MGCWCWHTALLAVLTGAAAPATGLSATYVHENTDALWSAFKETHGKQYPSPSHEHFRRRVFVGNMLRSAELELLNPFAAFGPNKFADLTAHEFHVYRKLRRHPWGTRAHRDSSGAPSPKAGQNSATALSARGGGGVPNATAPLPPPPEGLGRNHTNVSVDWRVLGAVTGVSDQGSCGCCFAFSSVAGIESAQFIATKRLTPLSVQEVVSCDDNGWDHGCDGGWMPNTLDWIVTKRKGQVVTEVAYPYTSGAGGVQGVCADVAGKPVGAQIAGYNNYMGKSEVEMATILQKEGPIVTAVSSASWQTYQGGVLSNCASPFGIVDHGVVLVGVTPEYWILKNSWGDDWGESGYIRLAFGSDACHLTSIPIVPTVGTPTPAPEPPVPPNAFELAVYSAPECGGPPSRMVHKFGECFQTPDGSSAVPLACTNLGLQMRMWLGNINCQGFAVSVTQPVERCIVSRGQYVTNYCHKG